MCALMRDGRDPTIRLPGDSTRSGINVLYIQDLWIRVALSTVSQISNPE